jgi:hypothetical protein
MFIQIASTGPEFRAYQERRVVCCNIKPVNPSNCIYFGPHDIISPEHYQPMALGDFGEFQVLHGKVCRACNNLIGQRTETQFLRTGPIALFRWMLGV